MMIEVDPVQELHRAVEQGDIEHVQSALDDGMSIIGLEYTAFQI